MANPRAPSTTFTDAPELGSSIEDAQKAIDWLWAKQLAGEMAPVQARELIKTATAQIAAIRAQDAANEMSELHALVERAEAAAQKRVGLTVAGRHAQDDEGQLSRYTDEKPQEGAD